MFKVKILKDLKKAISQLGFSTTDIVLSIPENPDFGDYTTNIALQLSKQSNQNSYQKPNEIASEIIKRIGHPDYLERVEVAGVGFLNFFIKDGSLVDILDQDIEKAKEKPSNSKKYLVEYASPNAFKEYHIGHLRNLIVGETVARTLEFQGNIVFRVSYPSDIGPAAAKVIWGVNKQIDEFHKLRQASISEKIAFLGNVYIDANKSYEEDKLLKEEINQVNRKLYDGDPEYMSLWKEAKEWSSGYMDLIYSQMNTLFDAEIWESEVSERGKELVLENLDTVFIKDQGAIIFPGEKYGLHNRVFISSAGNPMYEAKDIALAFKEYELFPFDEVIHVVGSEQTDYFKVLFKAIEQIDKELGQKKRHLPYGFVSLTTGKMSSRKGNVISTEALIELVEAEIKSNYGDNRLSEVEMRDIVVASIKFFYLKYGLQTDITFDVEKSVSLQGDSGPYIMYVYTRIQSILAKADNRASTVKPSNHKIAQSDLSDEERALIRELLYFQDKVAEACVNFTPNTIAAYLLILARRFNGFYEKNPVLGSDSEEFRIKLIKKTADVIGSGLSLLGIKTVDRM